MKTRTLLVGTAALGAVAVGLTTPAAQADSQDDAFLAALAAQGVPAISGTKDLIRTGHEICANLGGGADAVLAQLVANANAITPGIDPGRLRRTEMGVIIAASQAYCPGSAPSFTNPSGYRVRLSAWSEGVNEPYPAPMPDVPDAAKLELPKAPEAAPPPKQAPPQIGPPNGTGGGAGGNGGGTGGTYAPQDGPGIVTIAP